jgi:hypothetical protein
MMRYTIQGAFGSRWDKTSKNFMFVPYLLDDDDGDGFLVPARYVLAVNHCSCRQGRRYLARALLICAAIAVTLPIRAHAQFTGKASATGQFETNSNVFDLPSGVAPFGANGRRSDTYFAYGADFDVNYLWGRQQIYATANTKEYDYQHFSGLNHNDYKVDTGLIWKLGALFDGKLEVTRTHNMVPFSDLAGSVLELSLLTEQRETAQVGLKLSSDWKIEASGYTSKSDEPIAEAPNLQLTQNSGTASIEYLGFGALTSGLTATYLSGDYSGTNGTQNPSFDQTTVGLLANYKVYRTTFEGQVGYSRRVSATGTDNTAGFTGLFDLKHQLTPKTSFTVKVDRMINSYFLNTGSEIDTEAGASIDWQTTFKLRVSVGYTFTYRFFPGQGNNPVGSDRTDIQELATMTINYQPQRWLQIAPYANVTTRRSTFVGGHFSQDIFGVSVIVTPYRPK